MKSSCLNIGDCEKDNEAYPTYFKTEASNNTLSPKLKNLSTNHTMESPQKTKYKMKLKSKEYDRNLTLNAVLHMSDDENLQVPSKGKLGKLKKYILQIKDDGFKKLSVDIDNLEKIKKQLKENIEFINNKINLNKEETKYYNDSFLIISNSYHKTKREIEVFFILIF